MILASDHIWTWALPPTVAMGPLADGSISNLACSIPNYLCTNFGAFIKKCTIDQLISSTIRGFVSNKNFVSGFVSDFASVRAFLTLPSIYFVKV